MISTNIIYENNNVKKENIKNGLRINLDIYIPYFRKTKEKKKVTLFPEETRSSTDFDALDILSKVRYEIENSSYNRANRIVNFSREEDNKNTKRKSVPTIFNINVFGGFFSLVKQEKIELLKGLLDIKKEVVKDIRGKLDFKVKKLSLKSLVSLNVEYPVEEIIYEMESKYTKSVDNDDEYNLSEDKLLKKYGVDKIYLEVYSTNKYLNEANGLNYSDQDIHKAMKFLSSSQFNVGIKTYLDIYDSYTQDYIENMHNILEKYSKDFIITIVSVSSGTGLEEKAKQKLYTPLKNTELIELLSNIQTSIAESKFKNLEYRFIHEPALYSEKYVEGPYMLYLKEMLESNIWYRRILSKIKGLRSSDKKVLIYTEEENIPKIQGENNYNLKKLKETYDVTSELVPYEGLKFLKRIKLRKKIAKDGLVVEVIESFKH